MTNRDRLVLMAIVVLAVLAGGWLLLVSPERKQAAQALTQIEAARQQLHSAQEQAASERRAEAGYAAAYVSVVKLGKAVPPLQEVPSLVYELDRATHQRDIEFTSITSGSSAGGSSKSSSAPTSGAAATPAAFAQMPFTFVFKGSYFGLAHLLNQIDGFAQTTLSGRATTPNGVQVSGRLLTIQGLNLAINTETAPAANASAGGKGAAAASPTAGSLTATITATAYVLPASQGLTAGATAAGPAGASPVAQASAAASTASSPASPAVIQGRP
jgi:hypothetical protein